MSDNNDNNNTKKKKKKTQLIKSGYRNEIGLIKIGDSNNELKEKNKTAKSEKNQNSLKKGKLQRPGNIGRRNHQTGVEEKI